MLPLSIKVKHVSNNREGEMVIHLLNRAKQGDQAAFCAVVQPMENRLYRAARSILRSPDDCADAIQDALLKAWLSLPRLHDVDRFEAWLMRILQNECRNLYKRNKRKPTYPLAYADVAGDCVNENPVRAALDLLPEKQRTIITLHHILGYSVEEIAHIEKLRAGTVKSRLSRARNALSTYLEGVK